jgi:hypothetical protein
VLVLAASALAVEAQETVVIDEISGDSRACFIEAHSQNATYDFNAVDGGTCQRLQIHKQYPAREFTNMFGVSGLDLITGSTTDKRGKTKESRIRLFYNAGGKSLH